MPSALRLVLAFPLIAAMTGCPSDNQDTGSTDISTSIAVKAGEPRCPAVHPDAAELPADAGRTPRADGDAEQLAVEAECALVASDAVYERVAAELTGMRGRTDARRLSPGVPYCGGPHRHVRRRGHQRRARGHP